MRAGGLIVGVLTLAAAASALAAPARAGAQPPPGFPNLDGFTAVAADGYATTPGAGGAPRIRFSVTPTLVCSFGAFSDGWKPPTQPSQDIKCDGDIPGMDDVPISGAGRPRPGDCVVGAANFKGPGYALSRMSYGGCDGNPPALRSGGKPLGAGQKLSYQNVTCAVGADDLVACLDTTSGDHGFVLQRSGSWAF